MVTLSKTFEFLGHKFSYEAIDMSDLLEKQRRLDIFQHPDTIYLVLNGDKVYVDKRAPEWYQELATVHEYICARGECPELFPGLPAGDERCANIDFRLVGLPKTRAWREDYLAARQKMFNLLVESGLNDSPGIKKSQELFNRRLGNL